MKSCYLGSLLVLALGGAFAAAQESSRGDTSLLPPPSKTDFDRGIVELRSVFSDDYKRTESGPPSIKLSLARKIMASAEETEPSSESYFPMHYEVIRLATEGENCELAFQATVALEAHYEVDGAGIRLNILDKFAAESMPLRAVREASKLIVPSLQLAANQQKLDIALKILDLGDTIATRSSSRPLQQELAQARETLTLLAAQEAKYEAAIETLKSDPNNQAANLDAACMLGLRLALWEEAEGFANRLDDDAVVSLFTREVEGVKEPADIAKLASDWWEFKETLTGVTSDQARDVAILHYQRVLKSLTGFEQRKAESRIAEAAAESVVAIRVESQAIAPEPAVSPLTEEEAKAIQEAWATYLNVPVEMENSIGMKFRLIPPGTFTMGSSTGRSDETPHQVTLTQSYYMGVTEVTQAQFEQVMGTNPSAFKDPSNPVDTVSWEEAAEFCRKLSALSEEKSTGRLYRLPTEAEWEYACRAGATTDYSFGDEGALLGEYGWYDKNSGLATHLVGRKRPNTWGLFDMHGNVWDWCSDWYGDYPQSAVIDPMGPSSGSVRVFRGGSWGSVAADCRAALRSMDSSSLRSSFLGFRVVFLSSIPE